MKAVVIALFFVVSTSFSADLAVADKVRTRNIREQIAELEKELRRPDAVNEEEEREEYESKLERWLIPLGVRVRVEAPILAKAEDRSVYLIVGNCNLGIIRPKGAEFDKEEFLERVRESLDKAGIPHEFSSEIEISFRDNWAKELFEQWGWSFVGSKLLYKGDHYADLRVLSAKVTVKGSYLYGKEVVEITIEDLLDKETYAHEHRETVFVREEKVENLFTNLKGISASPNPGARRWSPRPRGR